MLCRNASHDGVIPIDLRMVVWNHYPLGIPLRGIHGCTAHLAA